MNPSDIVVLRDFFIALLIGALVGIEREKHKTTEARISFGGLRTFILFALAGAVSAWLSLRLGAPWVFVATLIAISTIVVTGYVLETRVRPDEVGITTELAGITVFLLGGAVMLGYETVAVALGVVTAAVLTYKRPLHDAVAKIGTADLYAGLQLLIATFIILPALPDRTVDPWQALNPYRLWLLVILISALSLVGYVAVRWLGPLRGTLLTAVAGGLVSSTTVSLSLARQSATVTATDAIDTLAAGILYAWVVMFVRIAIVVAFVDLALVGSLRMPLAVMATASLLAAAWLHRRAAPPQGRREARPEVAFSNPFSLWAAIQFGLFFGAVLLVVSLAQRYASGGGLFVVAGIAGLTDVDAITLSMAGYAQQGGDAVIARTAIVIAAFANTLFKCGVVVVAGSSSLRRRVLPATALILVAGAAGLAAA